MYYTSEYRATSAAEVIGHMSKHHICYFNNEVGMSEATHAGIYTHHHIPTSLQLLSPVARSRRSGRARSITRWWR